MSEPATPLSQIFGDSQARMTISQCRRVAEEAVTNGPCKITFDLCGPKGRKRACWLDPYLGFIRLEGNTGFIMAKDLEMIHDLWVENVDIEAGIEQQSSG